MSITVSERDALKRAVAELRDELSGAIQDASMWGMRASLTGDPETSYEMRQKAAEAWDKVSEISGKHQRMQHALEVLSPSDC